MEKQYRLSQTRVALLIDADNVSSLHASELFNKSAAYGSIIVRKAYGVMRGAGFAWKPDVLHRHAIEPVVRFHYVKGKNVSDIALVIDAMELMRLNIVDAICIASNDSDFSLLAMKLRENGVKVYGFGNRPSDSFVASCDEYTHLTLPQAPLLPEGQATTVSDNVEQHPITDISFVKTIISNACDSLDSDDDGWINMALVGAYIRRVDPAFVPKNYGFDKLKPLVESMSDEFEVKYNETTLTASIRQKNK